MRIGPLMRTARTVTGPDSDLVMTGNDSGDVPCGAAPSNCDRRGAPSERSPAVAFAPIPRPIAMERSRETVVDVGTKLRMPRKYHLDLGAPFAPTEGNDSRRVSVLGLPAGILM